MRSKILSFEIMDVEKKRTRRRRNKSVMIKKKIDFDKINDEQELEEKDKNEDLEMRKIKTTKDINENLMSKIEECPNENEEDKENKI